MLGLSEKFDKAAENYVASLGLSRENLTDDQWNIIRKQIKTQRLAFPFLIIVIVICFIFGCLYLNMWKKYKKIHISTISSIMETPEESENFLKSKDFSESMNTLSYLASQVAMQFTIGFVFFINVILNITLVRKERKKIFKILLQTSQMAE
ncbi:MAG: hypothetical protein JW804_01395 [Sedimentisphaerales bacterium]|nr:hypothetical protein [Sedimentisphaerales bacterium]